MNTVQVVTVDEVLSYLGIDVVDDMVTKNIERAILTADAYLKGSVGTAYPKNDPRSKELALIIISDLYDNRGLHSSLSGNVRLLVDSLSLQLKLELSRSTDPEESNIFYYPYIAENLNWYAWDPNTQTYIDTGIKAKGDDGYSPKKYVDYWTDEDKAEMDAHITDEINNKIGDISTALDRIIEIQNELIGGESV